MTTINNTITELVDTIGARPACSDNERNAAEWINSEFHRMGLSAAIHDFQATTGSILARALYDILIILCVVGIGFFRNNVAVGWGFFVALVLVIIASFFELNGILVLNRLFRRGPSQNVVARYTPASRASDARRKKVVVLAHYDTCVVTPLTSSESAFPKVAAINRYITIALPFLSLFLLLPLKFMTDYKLWFWYFLLALCIVPLVMAIDALSASVIKRYSLGANNNASGVAAMMEVARVLTEGKITPAEKTAQHTSSTLHQVPAIPSTSYDSDEAFPDDFSWSKTSSDADDSADAKSEAAFAATQRPVGRTLSSAPDIGMPASKTPDFGVPDAVDLSQPTVSFAPVRSGDTGSFPPLDTSTDEVLGSDIVGASSESEPQFEEVEKKPSIFSKLRESTQKRGRGGRRRDTEDEALSWLGLDDDFNARRAGKDIGTWDNFNEDDDDGFSWKGGSADGDIIGDPDFALSTAAHIRAMVAEKFDADLDEKELWFVATGAQCQNSSGMKAFLEEYGPELRDALFINIDAVGSGGLFWRVEEGRNVLHKASSRLVSIARRVSRNEEIRAKAARRAGIDTDATQALREGFRAVTITRLDSDMAPTHRCSVKDVKEALDLSAIDETARFVAAMVREA